MSRVFVYCRVSSAGQETANQVREVKAAGFTVAPRRVVEEVVSGSVPAMEREGFAKLVDKLEADDVLVVNRLDRLGRNAMDVRATVEKLAAIGVQVHCLTLGGMDLCSAAGRLTMAVISAVAEFERDLLIERTLSGQARAKAEGVKFGRPSSLNAKQADEATRLLAAGGPDGSVSAVARKFNTSRRTIQRIAAAAASV